MQETDSRTQPIIVWGLPLAPYTLEETLIRIAQLIEARKPSFFITANLHYAMLSDRLPQLREVNERAAFILADGMPLVWASRLQKTPLPERVAGSDLIWRIAEQASRLGHRLFLLGGLPGIADQAAIKLHERYPGVQIVGTYSPPYRPPTEQEENDLVERIRSAQPDILMVAFGQPKGEFWIVRFGERIGVPVCVQVGASLDFVAGKVRRAPRWIQRIGLEWAFRLMQEPRRLVGRYWQNGLFLMRMLLSRRRVKQDVRARGTG